jgi:ADP-heptose:LPS heptosyltransferase
MELEIKKILVKLPKLGDMIFLTFPFITILSEEFPKAEIQLIVEEGDMLALMFLPFKVKAIERPSDKKNLLETHQFVANTNEIFNVDLFFDLENTFNSAFIGFNFRAKERVGYDKGWNKHLLTKRYRQEFENNFERTSVRLLELYLNKSFNDFKIAHPIGEPQRNEKIDKLFNEPEPPKFILIMLDNFSSVTKDIELWKKFFDSFEKQKFIIWTLKDEDIISEIFAKIDLDKNELYMHRGTFPKELNYILKKVTGIVVNNTWAESLCGYYNCSFVTFSTSDKAAVTFSYFKFRPLRIFFKDNLPTHLEHIDEDRKFESMNEVADFIHFNFKL